MMNYKQICDDSECQDQIIIGSSYCSEQMQCLMKQSNFSQSEIQPPIRKRNYSLGSKPQPQSEHHHCPEQSEHSLSPKHSSPIYTTRKNRVLLKLTKFKKIKDNARLCQQNINQYNQLKKQLTSKYLSPTDYQQHPPPHKHAPKLSIKNLGIALNCSVKSKHKEIPSYKHCKTENQHQIRSIKIQTGKALILELQKFKSQDLPSLRRELAPIKQRVIKRQGGMLKRYALEDSQELANLKKYSQMSLRERVEVEDVPRYSLLLKLQELKMEAKEQRARVRRPSDEYMLQGW